MEAAPILTRSKASAQEVDAGCEVVQLGQSLWQPVSCARKEKGLSGIPTDSGESPDAPVPYGDLQVDR